MPFAEPFPRIRLGGLIVKDGAKMSKSRGNVIGPDDYVRREGSDVLRCALLFSAPWEQGGDFVEDAIGGIERFFSRVWAVVVEFGGAVTGGGQAMTPSLRPIDAAVRRATGAIERLRFNVALAAAMELTGWIEGHGAGLTPDDRGRALQSLVLLLAPLAPHLAEELWERIGGRGSVHVAPWPQPVGVATAGEVDLVVQVDGRVRDRLTIPHGLDEAAAVAAVLASPKVVRVLDGRTVTRAVHVPDRLVNLVTA